ncbi:MAG: BrnT family toxin [Firmicutes bacterium]|nr:BrnT family toxin [Bacillota bacterium]
MLFEYDPIKSKSNQQKHGIDFVIGQKLFADPRLIIIRARTEDEPRYLAVGKIDDRCWSAIITVRNDKVRLISIRRSRPEEVVIYES